MDKREGEERRKLPLLTGAVTLFEDSTRAVHWNCRTIPSGPVISSHIMGPMSGAACARGPIREPVIISEK